MFGDEEGISYPQRKDKKPHKRRLALVAKNGRLEG
jgi:hypothetical protein